MGSCRSARRTVTIRISPGAKEEYMALEARVLSCSSEESAVFVEVDDMLNALIGVTGHAAMSFEFI